MAVGNIPIQIRMSLPDLEKFICLAIIINTTIKNRPIPRARRRWNRANHSKESNQIL